MDRFQYQRVNVIFPMSPSPSACFPQPVKESRSSPIRTRQVNAFCDMCIAPSPNVTALNVTAIR